MNSRNLKTQNHQNRNQQNFEQDRRDWAWQRERGREREQAAPSPPNMQPQFRGRPESRERYTEYSPERISPGAGFRRRDREAAVSPPRSSRTPQPPSLSSDTGGTWRTMALRPGRREEREGSESRRKRRREDTELPPPGQPGGLDDPNRRNLCGSRTKWYLRYLKAGYPAPEAIRMAREPNQPVANFQPIPEASWEVAKREEPEVESRKWSPLRDESDLKVVLVPLGYPDSRLSHQEKIDLEEAITNEVATSRVEAPLRFKSVAFRKGYLEVDCFNRFAADWLLRTGAHLSTYDGPPVEAKPAQDLEQQQKQISINFFLPRSSDKPNQFLRQLLKSQNEYDIDSWTLISRQDRGAGVAVTFGIDERSAQEIAQNGHTLFYRMGTVPVRGLKHLTKEQPDHDHEPADQLESLERSPPHADNGHRNSNPYDKYYQNQVPF